MFEKCKLRRKIKKLNKAVDSGNTQAMYDLAMIYLDGSVIKKDVNKAFNLLTLAAEMGHLPSKTFLLSNKVLNGAVVGAKAVSDIIDIFTK